MAYLLVEDRMQVGVCVRFPVKSEHDAENFPSSADRDAI